MYQLRQDAMPLALKLKEDTEPKNAKNAAVEARKAKKSFSLRDS